MRRARKMVVDNACPPSTSSVPDSHVSPCATTDTDGGETMIAGCGQRSVVLWASLSPDMSCWKTSQGYSIKVEDSDPSSRTWPRSGLMRSGNVYQLAPLVPRTIGKESGLWPTVQATDSRLARRRGYTFDGHDGTTLTDAVLIHHDAMPARTRGERSETPLAPNPVFCERLLGFPEGWTDCTHLATPLFQI